MSSRLAGAEEVEGRSSEEPLSELSPRLLLDTRSRPTEPVRGRCMDRCPADEGEIDRDYLAATVTQRLGGVRGVSNRYLIL